jgi:hypothetical protein
MIAGSARGHNSLVDNAPNPNGLVPEFGAEPPIRCNHPSTRGLARVDGSHAHRHAYIFSGSANTYIALWPRTGLMSLTTPSSPAVPD